MSHRPTHPAEHADYRTRTIEADRSAARIVEGLRNKEPWALRLAAVFEPLYGPMPTCGCDKCEAAEQESDDS